jgi:hypothetical protein
MKKNLLLLTFLCVCGLSNAQFYEDFEKGVPGSMTQKFQKGETSFIDFCIAAVGVEKSLSGDNSAVFLNGMSKEVTASSLETPVLDLSSNDFVLEFKHLQRQLTEKYSNEFVVEISTDGGDNFKTIATYNKPSVEMENGFIDLNNYTTTATTIIRFRMTQFDADLGLPIVIDEISIHKKVIASGRMANRKATIKPSTQATVKELKTGIYPNPSTGVLNIVTDSSALITVFDTNGRKILEQESTNSETTINLSNFPNGIYFVKTETSTETETQKIILK